MLPSRVSSWGALVIILLVAWLVPRGASALEPPSRVSVLTMGPGDHPFTRFGHNAILLEWPDGRDAVYNYGTFEFDGLRGAQDFMAGRFRYWLSVGSLAGTLRAYGAAERALTAQELSLNAAERGQLFESLAHNALPEHRYYDYDYYRDNCSTRVRDALDRVLGGALGRQVTGAGRLTFRQHTLRLVDEAPLLYFGLDSALGWPTDRPTSRWEELFLPRELHDELARARRPDTQQPLVVAERVLLTADRAPLSTEPPARIPLYTALGVSLGAALAGLGALSARSRHARAAFGAITALLGLALGLLGCALLAFWCSKHWAAHDNPSFFTCPPWALLLTVLGARLARGKASRRAMSAVLGPCVMTSLGVLVVAVTSHHESLRQAALFVPWWSGWLYGAWRAGSGPSPLTA